MARISKRWTRVLSAAVLVATAAGLSASTSGAASPGITVTGDAGYLQIHFSNSGGSTITYHGPLPIATSQSVSVSGKCTFTSTGGLLTFSQSGAPNIGMVGNGIGGQQKNTCSSAEGRFGGTETITLALGSAFGSEVNIDHAELDIEGKFNAVLGVSLDGAATKPTTLANVSDNGPDSGIGDNNRVVVNGPYRSITLSTSTGEASLEGGGDGTYSQYLAANLVGTLGQSVGTADTLLHLTSTHTYDGTLNCGDTLYATGTGTAASSASITRLTNDGGTTCDLVGLTFVVRDDGVLLDKGTTGTTSGAYQAVNSQVTIVWAPTTATSPLPARQINYAGDAGGVFENVKWCLGTDGTGDVIHPADSRFAGGLLPWCLISNSEVQGANGKIVQTQIYDGKGDPLWK